MGVRRYLAASSALALAIGVAATWGSISALAQSTPVPEMVAPSNSTLGNYLAGRHARGSNETDLAATYFGRALTKLPGDDVLLGHSFEMQAIAGRWSEAELLALRVASEKPDNKLAQTFLGLVEFKRGNYDAAKTRFQAAAGSPLSDLASTLARAWTTFAAGDAQGALDLLDQTKPADWQQTFMRYHRALIADAAGRSADARASYDRLGKGDGNRLLRLTLAFARHAAAAGDRKAAIAALKGHIDRLQGDPHPSVRALLDDIEHGDTPELLVKDARHGMAEIYFGLGEALGTEAAIAPATQFLQFALYLVPDFPFALVSLANVYETTKQFVLANQIYERVPPGTPLEAAIGIRRAMNLNALNRVDEAKAILDDAARNAPTDLRPLDALGSIMRAHKRYEEAVSYYSRIITLITKPEARHWHYFYTRGTSYERTKRWPQAEADLQTALKLSPDQPLVLNYLGYSWVDQNRNLKQGMALIEKAVRLKPDDGYIVDSLGWAHYRLGNFKEAVRWLERAVELRPEDPVLNDHLGDAYWRVGREREARFQWEQSLTLKPEPDEAEKTMRKIKSGLPLLAQPKSAKQGKQAERKEFQRKRTDAQQTTPGPSIQ